MAPPGPSLSTQLSLPATVSSSEDEPYAFSLEREGSGLIESMVCSLWWCGDRCHSVAPAVSDASQPL